ncbi:methyltransferase domain-containing protein [Sphingomonas rubra]|uniref:Methyltransferase domain-containing protein n=1 Tax=Sphingomonas rubra TaxID=634430 RepID=A0A1I5QXJ3_9SPHN|nr:methyltransferase domain-containing protein [Sphingomonas rubra]SFP50536.1 Methyltransferase domain-containing protein [Sphingomonas rubra]
MRRFAAALLCLAALAGCQVRQGGGGLTFSAPEPRADVPYVPTPDAVVAAMLDMAKVGPGDVLIDLGSGDGRIPIAAGERGARALGIEIDGDLVARARARARDRGVSERVDFRREDLFGVRLRDATVVTLYLLPAVNQRLRPKLLTELRPGTRIVSHAFDMGDWPAEEHRLVEEKHVYRWTVPATAGGDWRLVTADGRARALNLEQRFSAVSGTLDGRPLTGATLVGTQLSFTADGQRYRALVGDAAIEPDPAASPGTVRGWRATRVEG